MSNTKPASIWITQFLLLVWGALPGLVLLLSILLDLSAAVRGFVNLEWVGESIRFLWASTHLVVVGGLVWALERIKRHSRFAAGVVLLVLYFSLFYGSGSTFDFLKPQWSPTSFHVEDPEGDQRLPHQIAGVVMTYHLAVALLLYRLWFGKRVRRFFESGG